MQQRQSVLREEFDLRIPGIFDYFVGGRPWRSSTPGLIDLGLSQSPPLWLWGKPGSLLLNPTTFLRHLFDSWTFSAVCPSNLLSVSRFTLEMAETQPPTVVEGATTGDVDDEIPVAAKSAEDRKAAAALSSLDAPREDESANTKDVDQEAVRKAMERLGGSASTNGAAAKKDDEKKVVKKAVKVDPADVTLLVRLLGVFLFLNYIHSDNFVPIFWLSVCQLWLALTNQHQAAYSYNFQFDLFIPENIFSKHSLTSNDLTD